MRDGMVEGVANLRCGVHNGYSIGRSDPAKKKKTTIKINKRRSRSRGGQQFYSTLLYLHSKVVFGWPKTVETTTSDLYMVWPLVYGTYFLRFRTQKHGIFITQIPRRLRHWDILKAISGAMVRRIHLFRPGTELAGDAVYAAVFFLNEAKCREVLERINLRGGLWIEESKRRYRTIEYIPPPESNPMEEILPNGATRIISMTFDDSPPNLHISTGRVLNVIRNRIPRLSFKEVEVRQSRGVRQASPSSARRTAFRRITIELTGISMALEVKGIVGSDTRLRLTGPNYVIQFERDPCLVRALEDMV